MIKRLVTWGGLDSLDSFRHIMRAYHETAKKLEIDTIWVDDIDPAAQDALRPGDTVIAADVTGRHLPYREDVNYCLHNFDGGSDLCRALEQTPERLLRLQVWTIEANGEEWDACREFNRDARTLFQPWGTDLLAEEFLPPVFNPDSRDITFVGAVWSDQYEGVELGNEAVIGELRDHCVRRSYTFRHLTQIPVDQLVAETRGARLAPAFAGAWQVEKNYLPCRAFKTAAYGALSFGDVPLMENLLGAGSIVDDPWGATVAGTMDAALRLNRAVYTNLVREQQRVVARYTYRQNIEAIARAFEEIRA